MAKIDLATITEPLGDEQPCGPDLDMEYDPDFMNFTAEIDGRIPTAFFSFDPGSLDFDSYYDRIGELLQRTRDVRILVPLAKLRILQSDLGGFAETLDAIHRLLKERWSDLHPQPPDFLELNMGQLATLDDMPNVILPLQHAPLVRSRRAGAITLRKWQVAKGEVNPRDGEETVDAGTLTTALAESDAESVQRSKEALLRARDAVAGIRNVCIQEAGYERAPSLERLPAAVETAITMIDAATGGAAAQDDAAAETAGAGQSAATAVVQLPSGAVRTREQAVEAMHVAARYFALREPSSPVPMLLREAQAATKKSFYELVNDLVPDSAASAFVSLGAEPWFEVYLSTLDARNPAPDYYQEIEEEEIAEDAGLGDEEAADEGSAGEGAELAKDQESDSTAGSEAGESEEDAGEVPDSDAADEADGEQVAESPQAIPDEANEEHPAARPDPQAPPAGSLFTANSRTEAVALLRQVLEYYRVAEPSSPVPLLVERAIDMSSRSFIDLLGKILPDGALKVKAQDAD